MKKKDNNVGGKVLLSMVAIALLIVVVVGVSMAAFSYTKPGEHINTVSTGSVSMTYISNTNGINIENALPTSNEDGMGLMGDDEHFDFTVSGYMRGKNYINYDIVATKLDKENEEEVLLADEYVKLYLEKKNEGGDWEGIVGPTQFDPSEEKNELTGSPAGTMRLVSGVFKNAGSASSTVTISEYYRFRMWVADTYVLDGVQRNYRIRIDVYGKGVE